MLFLLVLWLAHASGALAAGGTVGACFSMLALLVLVALAGDCISGGNLRPDKSTVKGWPMIN